MAVTHISSFSGGTNFSATHSEAGVACGTGSNRVAYVLLGRINNSTPEPTTCSVGSDTLTASGAGPFTDSTGRKWRLFSGALTVTGTQTVSGAWSTDDGFALMSGVILQVADSATHIADLVTGAAVSSTAMDLTVAASGAGDAVLLSYQNDGHLVTTGAGTTALPAQDGVNGTPAPIYFQALTEAISGAGNVVIGGTTATPAEWRAVAFRVPSDSGGTPPTITLQPTNQTVTAPATATFTASATGSPTPTVQWQRNGTNISGATSSSYTTPSTAVTGGSANNGDVYSARFTNALGFVQTLNVTLTVSASGTAPSIAVQPASQSVFSGATATFTVSAAGSGTLTYQWRRNGSNISGATSASYTTPATTVAGGSANSGDVYSVVVTGDTSPAATSSNATLTVTAAATFSMTFGPFALNTGAGQRVAGEAFDWWAFSGVVIGGDIDAATRRRGSGTLNASGLAVIAGLPSAGSWEVQVRFPGDAEPEKGTMRDTLTAA
jgi:hypothetical protein